MESVVYLYSKYSSRCKEFSDTMTRTTLNGSFNTLCVDNKDIRKVVTSSKYSIKSLPCVLCFFPNSVVEKYEGDHAFRWLEQFLIPSPPPPPKPQPVIRQEEVQEEEEEEDDVPQPPPPKKKTRKQISNETSNQKTSIEDILASNEDDDDNEEEDQVQELSSSDINTMIKKSTKQAKVSDIMSRAQQLQKLREEEETEKTKKK